jgi:hypothetical protein
MKRIRRVHFGTDREHPFVYPLWCRENAPIGLGASTMA